MNKELLLYKAKKIADKAHKGQKDRYGAPYIGHVMRVSNSGRTTDEKIVGALHDLIEDCPDYDYDFLRAEGFPEYILFAIKCLTKTSPDENYEDFILRTEKSPLSIAVKLNDLRDNMDITRINRPLNEKDLKRLNKYLKAYRYLTEKY